MAETLTQEQIDALLNSAMSGGVMETSADKSPPVKDYDFRAPKKFTKERIKILDSIFDNYARLLSSYLNLYAVCPLTVINALSAKLLVMSLKNNLPASLK